MFPWDLKILAITVFVFYLVCSEFFLYRENSDTQLRTVLNTFEQERF